MTQLPLNSFKDCFPLYGYCDQLISHWSTCILTGWGWTTVVNNLFSSTTLLSSQKQIGSTHLSPLMRDWRRWDIKIQLKEGYVVVVVVVVVVCVCVCVCGWMDGWLDAVSGNIKRFIFCVLVGLVDLYVLLYCTRSKDKCLYAWYRRIKLVRLVSSLLTAPETAPETRKYYT